MLVRVSPAGGPGTLAKVRLSEISLARRVNAARRFREEQWESDLRPDGRFRPSRRARYGALLAAVEVTRAALEPSDTVYRVAEISPGG